MLAFSFIAFTIIGTISHESGHYMVAKCLGYEAKINYASTWYYDKNNLAFRQSHWKLYSEQIKSNQNFPDKEKWDRLQFKQQGDSFWITLGGGMQTMLTGTVGLFILWFFRKRYYSATALTFPLWLLVFISLFWLRQAENFFVGAAKFLVHDTFRSHSDEFVLARRVGIPEWTISTILLQ